MRINEVINRNSADENCDWCKTNTPMQYIYKVDTRKGKFHLCLDCYEELDTSGEPYKDLDEDLTMKDLNDVEKFADALWGKVGIDVEFTRHFLDRVNDQRNGKPISAAELIRLFKKAYHKYGKQLADEDELEAVMTDLMTQINLPFVINDRGDDTELVAKTVMRKKDFKTTNPKFTV